MKNTQRLKRLMNICLLVSGIGLAGTAHAAPLINFPFNEGTGTNVVDSVNGLIGRFGAQQDPALDYVELSTNSPSGQPGDGSIITFGGGFLLADDSTQVLDITNGPITMEAWVYLPPVSSNLLGIASYGNSYKMGLRGGFQVFTLYGQKDITNIVGGFVFDSQWNHLVAAWEPGVGVHFYLNGVHNFVEYTNSMAARPITHNYLILAAENFANNLGGSLDRVRIHHALLDETQIDSDAANPKAPLASTLVSYNFNETSFPCTNAIAPSLPTIASQSFLPSTSSPDWTNDTPTGLANDFALSFDLDHPFREMVTVNFGSTPIELGVNNTNYALQAWIKMPTTPLEERRIIYRTDGPAPRIAFSINSTRTLHTTITGVADFTTTVAVPNDNRWHHVAVVMEDYARLRFYLDGILRQTVNRTQTGTATPDGSAQMRIGKESETRYFHGLLDRVIVHNNALTNSTLDFPAIPGLATFDTLASHPANVITNAGATVNFAATPTSSSSASYQWRYRSKLADAGANIAGQTTTTLTLNNVGATNEGFYSLVVSNAVGVSESYAARLTLVTSLNLHSIGFETPTYVSGPLEEQDYWTNDQNGTNVQVLPAAEIATALQANGQSPAEPVHGGAQALVVSGPGLATTSIRTITGFETETNVTLDVWFRPITGTTIGNTFFTMENSTGVRAAAFRIGPAYSIDYGTSTTGVWQATGSIADSNSWTHITMKLNYVAKTYDFFINGAQVNVNPIAFYTATSDRLTQIRIFKGASQVGAIFDDLSIQGTPVAPTLGIRRDGSGGLILFWPASVTDYVLEGAGTLPSATWNPVSYTTVGNENQATVQPGTGNQFYRLRK